MTHVRDIRQPGHFWADNEIVDDHLPAIGVYGFAVYMMLAKHANKTGQCDPSVEGIARKLSISAPTVRKALDGLEQAGLITIKRRRRERNGKLINQTSMYTLLAVEKHQTDTPGKPGLVGNEIDQGTKRGLGGVVNVVDQGTKGDLPGVLNHVSSNKTHKNKKEGEGETELPTPALEIYIRLTGRQPNTVDLEYIAKVTDPIKWEQVVKDWLASGYKAGNVKGMLDWYQGKGRHQQNGQPASDSRPALPVKPFTPAADALSPEARKRVLGEIKP